MAGQINMGAYSDALVVLGTAAVVVPVVKRWGISPVIGYLCAGALLGPLGLGSFIKDIPALYWVTIVDAKNVAGIADLGVVFLLFLIGLELSFERLQAMRRLVIGLGGLQMLVSTAVLTAICMAAGLTAPVALLIGACLALSSTAIVLEVLSAQGRMSTSTGRTSFAILLGQDLAVIPVLMYVSVLSQNSQEPIVTTIAVALLQAAAAFGFIILFGRLFLRPLFRMVSQERSDELFIAATLFIIVATSIVAAKAGISMALGAFVAGLLLAETEYSRAIEATIEPFKGLLLGLFFFTVGMNIDPRVVVGDPFRLIACVVGLVVVKTAVILALARWFGVGRATSIETALLLGPSGEFAFVGVGIAATAGAIDAKVAAFVFAVTALTMLAIPVLGNLGRSLGRRFEAQKQPHPALEVKPEPRQKHAIVIGYGRVGKVVCDMLDRHGVAYTATDHNPGLVTAEREQGCQVFYGEAGNAAFLRACGLENAAGVIVTINSRREIDAVVTAVRDVSADIPIVSRARDSDHARHLYEIGVTDAVPETVEASLQLSEAALVGLGVPTGPVIATIHEKRDEFRHALQAAAKNAGRAGNHSIRGRKPAPPVL